MTCKGIVIKPDSINESNSVMIWNLYNLFKLIDNGVVKNLTTIIHAKILLTYGGLNDSNEDYYR